MKVEIDTAALADAVAWTSRVIDARPSNPILAGVNLKPLTAPCSSLHSITRFPLVTTSKLVLMKSVPLWFWASFWLISPSRCVPKKPT